MDYISRLFNADKQKEIKRKLLECLMCGIMCPCLKKNIDIILSYKYDC